MLKNRTIDMTTGSVLGKLLLFAAPLVLTNILQLLYNAADTIIIGRFDGSMAQAAVGATSPVINLITNLFMGLSVGVSVVVAQHWGAYQEKDVGETVHTSILTSIICGVFVCIVGLAASKSMLDVMGTPPEVLDQAVLYIRIYFLGIPAAMVYNFGSAIMRAVGDTRQPLFFLTIAGLINVGLNVLFVVGMKMGVAGVAIATIVSQTLSALMVIHSLRHANGCYRLNLKKVKIHWDKLARILKIGIPTGLQNSLFSVSNVLIQSSINSFGTLTVAAHTAAVSIEGFVNTAVSGVADASTNFVGQNYGAGKYKRISKVCGICAVTATMIAVVGGALIYIFGRELLGIFNDDPAVIDIGMNRLKIVGFTFWVFALMQVYAGCLRGMGHSVQPMVASLLGVCGLRILYIYTVFPLYPTLFNLYLSYPVSWTAAMLATLVCYLAANHKLIKQDEPQQT